MTTKILILICFSFVLFSCTSEVKKEKEKNKVTKETIKIDKKEKRKNDLTSENTMGQIVYKIWDLSDDLQNRSASYKIELAEGLIYTLEKSFLKSNKLDYTSIYINSVIEYTFTNDKNDYNLYLKFSNGSIIDSRILYTESNDSYMEIHKYEELSKSFKESTLQKVRVVNMKDESYIDYNISKYKTEDLRKAIKTIEGETPESIKYKSRAAMREERARQKEKDLEGF